MKTIIYILSILFLFSFIGCDDFLVEEPKDLISPGNFFANEDDARAAITGVYANWKNNSLYGQVGLDGFYENGTDILGPNRDFGIVQHICAYTMNPSNAENSIQKMGVADTWKDLYKIVLSTNLILDNIVGNEAIPPDIRNEFEGETLFLRSFAYFHLTNLWGDVPYYRTALPINEISTLGRTSAEDIRADIIEDLEKAHNEMPDVVSENENGRATKWVAAMVLAKIHLFQENWSAALNISEDIINNGPYSLLSNFDDVFDPFNEYNSEIIWELDFAKDLRGQAEEGRPDLSGNGNWTPSMFSPRLRDEPLNDSDKDLLVAALNENGEAFNGTGLQIPLPDLVNNFPANDLRRSMTIQDTYEGIQLVFPYFPKKWNLDIATSPRFNHSDNKIIYRLADTYLMAAEAENELNGPTAKAYDYIHRVRSRAYESQVDWELSGLSKDQFREAIQDERKWELAAESHRKFDLIRWGILIETVQNTEYRVYPEAATNIQPHHTLLPIPEIELALNPALLESDPTNNGYQ